MRLSPQGGSLFFKTIVQTSGLLKIMSARIFAGLIYILPWFASAQVVTTTPIFPKANQPVTITIDVTGTSLDGYDWNNTARPVWIWTWIVEGCPSNCDAPTNVNPATSPAQDAAKVTRISTDPDVYQITITPTTFFNRPASEIKKIGLKLKTRNWSDNIQTDNDRFIEFAEGFLVKFALPASFPVFKNNGEEIVITANASEISDLSLTINGSEVLSENDATTISYTHTVSEISGSSTVTVTANNGTEEKESSFIYIIRTPTIEESRPAGVIDGMNYSNDPTEATLSLWAPGKNSAYVVGDFNDWSVLPEYQMKKDGEHFWLEIAGLVPGEEYAFQYLVDETIYMADPYADKILDPDDQYIPASTYPDLKSYPTEALSEKWYFNRVAVLQTGQEPYGWQADDFQKPAKEELIIYELLIRDFFAEDQRTYQNLIDTINYFKRLGVNAIELMPIMEFNGNESWGYNPAFMFAPDKYYGQKNDLKAFIDKCHEEGIAVILDITMNHHDLPNPYVMMDFNFTTFKPTANNKWFNTDATHPFNVFFDMNHESEYTQKYLDTVNYYWLKEYHIDGFRFDLSKGFTQTNSGGDVSAWSARDDSRISLIKRMADKIWAHSPDAYIILEHFADNSEEKELVEYRAAEGKGMMVWGNMNHAYNQNTMGFASGSDVNWIYHGTRDWTVPHVIGYMESHDEERLMFRNLQHGNSSGSYNVKDAATALERVKAAEVIFYTIPGPKMLWQFGEIGYDESINRCGDGSINDGCRVSPKPIKWEYFDDPARNSLFQHTSELLTLRKTYDVFTSGEATLDDGTTLIRQITLKNTPYTTTPFDAADMNVQIVVNFDVIPKSATVNFPHAGTWYDYYENGQPLEASQIPFSIALAPGEYKLFTDYPVAPLTTEVSAENKEIIITYPSPVEDVIHLRMHNREIKQLTLLSMDGKRSHPQRISTDQWSLKGLSCGMYVAEIQVNGSIKRIKIFKK